MKTLLYEYTTTDGKIYQVWSTGENTGDVETKEIKKDEEELKKEYIVTPFILKDYENIIKDKLIKPIDLKGLYEEQYNGRWLNENI